MSKDKYIDKNELNNVSKEIKKIANDVISDTLSAFVRTTDVVNRYLNIELSKYGANTIRVGLLNVLVLNGGIMTPTDLSKKLFRSRHTITTLIDGLVKDGLVRRESNEKGDRRVHHVFITKKGLDFIKAIVANRNDIDNRVLSCFGEESKVLEFNALLRQLRKHVAALLREGGYIE